LGAEDNEEATPGIPGQSPPFPLSFWCVSSFSLIARQSRARQQHSPPRTQRDLSPFSSSLPPPFSFPFSLLVHLVRNRHRWGDTRAAHWTTQRLPRSSFISLLFFSFFFRTFPPLPSLLPFSAATQSAEGRRVPPLPLFPLSSFSPLPRPSSPFSASQRSDSGRSGPNFFFLPFSFPPLESSPPSLFSRARAGYRYLD